MGHGSASLQPYRNTSSNGSIRCCCCSSCGAWRDCSWRGSGRCDGAGRWASPWSGSAAEQANQLPKTRPEGIGRRCWRAVCEIYALTRKGGQWIDVSSLLDTVREGTGDKSLSLRTLKTALSYLRKGGFIDR